MRRVETHKSYDEDGARVVTTDVTKDDDGCDNRRAVMRDATRDATRDVTRIVTRGVSETGWQI